jgi:hypothetical protein
MSPGMRRHDYEGGSRTRGQLPQAAAVGGMVEDCLDVAAGPRAAVRLPVAALMP